MFTRGSAGSLRFADRPMWLTVDTSASEAVTFEAHDETNDGQPVRLDADWLASHGVASPVIAYHHDGTPIAVDRTADGEAVVVDAPHFSHITVTSATLDLAWQTEGHTREFYANGPNASGGFNITVSDVATGMIEFKFWDVANGSTKVFDGGEPFEKTSRESQNRSGYYTFNYINETNLDTGYAMLGGEQFHLVEVNVKLGTYDFSGGNLTYRFDQVTGFLEDVRDDRNEATIIMQDTGTETVPANHDPLQPPRTAYITNKHIYSSFYYESANELDADQIRDWNRCHPDDIACTDQDAGPDQEVQGHILSTHTDVRVETTVKLVAEIITPKNDPCFERSDCHTKSAVTHDDGNVLWNLYVDFDDGADWVGDTIITCTGQQCVWDDDDELWRAETQVDLAVTGTVEHNLLLEEGSVDFWACGQAIAWDNDGTRQEQPWGDVSVRCQKPSDPESGSIIADPMAVLDV